MELLHDERRIQASRELLMQYLNDNGLDGESILHILRQCEAYYFEPDEAVILQGQMSPYVYFLVEGSVTVYARVQDEYRELGEREGVCVLGEISFFTGSIPTADVLVRGPDSGVMFRLTFEQLAEIIDRYPGVREMLNRIGEMRLIAQNNGLISFSEYLEMTGNKRKRYLLDQRIAPELDRVVRNHLVPRIKEGQTMLEVGDGPGILTEILLDYAPEAMDLLHLQAVHMEDAIVDPFTPVSSDLARAKYLRRSFDTLATLQVFNSVPATQVMEQFRIARGLINPGGLLLIVKAKVVNVSYAVGSSETHLFFDQLEKMVDEAWPRLRGGQSLIETVFADADLDPLMGWNNAVVDRAGAGKLELPDHITGLSRKLLELLVGQARQARFNPDAIHFEWLAHKAGTIGFTLMDSEEKPDMGFYYQLYSRT